MGGFVGRDQTAHGEVLLAHRLRKQYAAALNVAVFENRRGSEARRKVLELLDTDGDGTLSAGEKSAAHIAIYGHSWGASETVTLARALERDGIPVMLTVQVDSVRKLGENDAWIPANVAQAVNFFQPEGIVRGRSEIRASDPAHTRILGNFQIDYRAKPVSCAGYPWYARAFMRPHIEIESDPAVWSRVEDLIRARLSLLPAAK